MGNVLENLNGNDVLDVWQLLDFLQEKEIITITDGRSSKLASALDEWS